MLKAVKQSVHRMTSHLQVISSYLEMEDYTKALGRTKESIKEMHVLEASLTGLANLGMTVPENGAVVVPHGSTVVSHEDVNVDVGSDEVRAVDHRMKSAPVVGTIIRRRNEDLIATTRQIGAHLKCVLDLDEAASEVRSWT
jgi:hypothetical protein